VLLVGSCSSASRGQEVGESADLIEAVTESETADSTTTEAAVVIINQINDINEDGSYTVG